MKLYLINLFMVVALMLLVPSCGDAPENPTVEQSPAISGHELMIKMLDSIAVHADPTTCYNLNSKKAELYKKRLESITAPDQMVLAKFLYGEELLYAGQTEAAIVEFTEVISAVGDALNQNTKELYELLALSYLRLGEQENCIKNHNAESCIIPIKGNGVYKMKLGLDNAIAIYKRLLKAFPNDLQTRWLMNIAYMNLGKYPNGVPSEYLIPERIFKGKGKISFKDIAIPLGLDVQGVSGSVCMDDFNGDGNLDLFMTSYGLADPVRYFENKGDGTFADKTQTANLKGIVSGLNTLHADYDNDGDRDIFILRGGWLEGGTHPNSLLRNNSDGTFTDVTVEAGLLSFHPTQTGAWADYDADGWLDLYIGNESFSGKSQHPNELYRNNGDGTFTNVANTLGLDLQGFYKGCAWGDVNNDRLPDLYLSNMSGDNILVINRGAGKFQNIALQAGVVWPEFSFPVWFFDYDNDGWEDIIVSGYTLDPKQDAAGDLLREYMEQLPDDDWFRLYKNNGDETFADVTKKAGLHKTTFAMGCNFGDLDNDGWTDFYLGTGKPDLRALVPNRMFRNVNGNRFEEITMNGFAHIQKGHGIAFGDLDNDGDQDIYEVMGGAYEGDISSNILFENPGHATNHWVTIELEGTTCNRDAIGSKIAVYTKQKNGSTRTIYTSVNTGASFGSASLQQEIGLGKAMAIEKVEVYWAQPGPAKSIYTDILMDNFIKIKEGNEKAEILNRKKIVFVK